MEQLAVGFLLGILSGGLVAVISSVLSFAYARRLQREDQRRRDAALLRALRAEVEENIERSDTAGQTRSARWTERTAWDVARTLPLDDDTFRALRTAYAEGADLNSRIGILDRRAGATSGDPSRDARIAKDISDDVLRTADRARTAFQKARDALAKL